MKNNKTIKKIIIGALLATAFALSIFVINVDPKDPPPQGSNITIQHLC